MSSYLIYIPGERNQTSEPLKRVGLGPALYRQFAPDALLVHKDGPDGGGGMLYAWRDVTKVDAGPPLCLGDCQWTPAKAYDDLEAGRFWMGRDPRRPVSPAGLLKRKHFGGVPVRMDDGQSWQVPIARQLPHKFGVAGREVKAEFAAFYARAEHYYNEVLNVRQGLGLELEGVYPFACQALALNYRVNEDIVDWLGLLSDDNMLFAVGATFELVDIRTVEAQKKKAFAGTLVTSDSWRGLTG